MPYPIRINGQEYDHQEILDMDLGERKFTPFESSVINFYQEWFSENVAFEFQTSGTTGPPKKITFGKQNLVHSARTTIEAFSLKNRMSILLCLHPDFVAGKMMIVRALEGGLRLVANEPSENPLQNLDQKIDFTAITPQQLYAILKDPDTNQTFQEIGKVIVGGGNINNELQKMAATCKNDVYHTYAMTETLTHVAIKKVSGRIRDQCFQLLPGFGIKQDNRNCLTIKTPYSPDRVVTNDIVEIIDSANFRWLGRYDNVINSGGIKIIPEEIEPVIERYFHRKKIFNRFFLFGLKDPKLGQKLVLVVEKPVEIEKETLLENLKSLLPKYKSPKDVILHDQFRTTTTGKINRKETIKSFLGV